MPRYASADGSNGSGPPPVYTESNHQERTPLLPTRQSHRALKPTNPVPEGVPYWFWTLIGAFLCIVLGYVIQTPLDSSYRQQLRAAWDRQKEAHEQWVSEAKAEKKHWDDDRWQRDWQDRWEREEHERRRHDIQWQGLQRSQCIRYGTRKYTSTLTNVPLGFNAVDECMEKTMWINGRDIKPTHCEDPGSCGKVIGHWEVDFSEPECTPSWGQIADKGCWGSRTRRYDGELIHISEYESWMDVCATMSARYGLTYLPPGALCTRCYGRGCGSGYWATWYIEDWSC